MPTPEPVIVECLNNLLLTTSGGPHRPGETVADVLAELCKQAGRIADALEEIVESMPSGA